MASKLDKIALCLCAASACQHISKRIKLPIISRASKFLVVITRWEAELAATHNQKIPFCIAIVPRCPRGGRATTSHPHSLAGRKQNNCCHDLYCLKERYQVYFPLVL